MNLLNALVETPLFTTLGWTLIHFIWQATLVALGLAGLTRLGRCSTPQSRYTAYTLALALMALVPLSTALLIHPSTAQPLAASPTAATTSAITLDGAAGVTQSTSWAPLLNTAQSYLPHLLVLWGLGVCFFSLHLGGGWLYCQYLKNRSVQPAAPTWQQTTARLAHRLELKRPVRLLESTRVAVPLTIGWLRPVILLPVGLLSGLTPQQLEAILLHELAHIRRYDYLVNILQRLMETLFFYHPAVWWISSQIRTQREYCCDDEAVAIGGNALVYARALTKLESQRQPATPLALAANDGPFFKRVSRLILPAANNPLPSRRFNGVVAALVLCALLGLFGGPLPDYLQTPVAAQNEPSIPAFAPLAPPRPPVGKIIQSPRRLEIKLWVDENGQIQTYSPGHIDSAGNPQRKAIKLKLNRLAAVLEELRPHFNHPQQVSISIHPDTDQELVGQVAKIAQEAGLVYQQLSFLPKPQIIKKDAPYSLKVEAAAKTHLKAGIHNVSGQEIRALHNSQIEPGPHTIVWDVKDNQGAEVENGIYFCRVQLGPENRVYKVVKK